MQTSRRTELSCDVLVIGAGPAGIAACIAAAEAGARVILVDDNPYPGGQIWRAAVNEAAKHSPSHREASHWLHRLRECGARMLLSTRAVARLAQSRVLAENEHELIEITFSSAILATGARELMLPFPGWTLPNVFAAGGLQALVKSGFPVQGKRVVVAGTGPLLLAVAAFLQSNGARIEGVYDQSSWSRMIRFGGSLFTRPSILRSALEYKLQLRHVPLRYGWWPVSANGGDRVHSLTVTNGNEMKRIGCDLVACGFHLVANSELPAAFGCVLAEDKVKVDDWQRTSEPAIYSAGESTGIGGLDLALIEGQIAGFAAAGERDRATRLFGKRTALTQWTRALEHAFALRPELRHLVQADTIICRCEDVRWSALAGQRSFRLAKLYTRCGMGPCQGRICGAALRFLSGWKNDFTRPPVYPVRLSTLIREPQSLLTANPGSGNVRGREAGTASLVGNKENP